MPYKLVDGQLVAETDKNYLSLSSSKRELFDALKSQMTRAEAAEARAAAADALLIEAAQVISDLRDERDAHTRTIERLLNGVETVSAERDAIFAENDAVHRVVNQMCGTDTSTVEAAQKVIKERNSLRGLYVEIREAVNANEDEAAISGVRRVVAERDEAQRKLEQAQTDYKCMVAALTEQRDAAYARNTELEGYIDQHNRRTLQQFECTAPVDWREAYQNAIDWIAGDSTENEAKP